MRELRPYQAQAISDLREALRLGSRRPLLMAPTGAGKTAIACEIIQSALARGKRVTFTVPAISLVDQTVRDFYGQGVRSIGVMQANHEMTDPTRRVQVASVQTLRRRQIPDTDLWIIDEAHRLDKGLTEIMGQDRWAAVPFIGLSATPWTKGLGRIYDKLIIATTTAELIEQGYLSPFRVFAPAHPDLSGVKTVAGEFQQDQLSEAMQAGALVGDIVSTWLRLGEGRPTLCFAVDRAHAMAIQASFQAAGVSCGYQDALTSRDERDEIAKKFRLGEYQVVVNIGTLTTGVDWDVRCIIMARPTKSEMLYVQIIGRGLRTAKGKQDCIILDHSDTTLRLGFVTDIFHDKLNGGKMDQAGEAQERKPPLPKECPRCTALRPPRTPACPSCGFAPKPEDAVSTVSGEIVELAGRRKAVGKEYTMSEKEKFYRELKKYQEDNNKNPGWVWHSYKEKFGVQPCHEFKYISPASTVSAEVSAWIRAKNIRFAKARNGGANVANQRIG